MRKVLFTIFSLLATSIHILEAQTSNDTLNVSYAGRVSGAEITREEVLSASILKLEGAKADIYRIESFRMKILCSKDSVIWRCKGNQIDDRIYSRNTKGCSIFFDQITVLDENNRKATLEPVNYYIAK